VGQSRALRALAAGPAGVGMLRQIGELVADEPLFHAYHVDEALQ
jgi:hypothetical protein